MVPIFYTVCARGSWSLRNIPRLGRRSRFATPLLNRPRRLNFLAHGDEARQIQDGPPFLGIIKVALFSELSDPPVNRPPMLIEVGQPRIGG